VGQGGDLDERFVFTAFTDVGDDHCVAEGNGGALLFRYRDLDDVRIILEVDRLDRPFTPELSGFRRTSAVLVPVSTKKFLIRIHLALRCQLSLALTGERTVFI